MADVSKFKIGTIIYNIKDAVARKVMKGAETNAAGEAGQVPAPGAGAANRYLRSDGSWQVPPDTNTTYGNMTAATANAAGRAGLVPAPGAGAANRYLRSDGSWQVPPDTNTTYGNMTAATANAAGRAGLVPAPGAGAQGKYLRGDGTWQTPPDTNTVYTHPSTHPASMISQDASHRFVTDTEKTAWNGKVNTSDIINNCTSTATNKPLSAAQGKALWDKYTQLNGDVVFIFSCPKNVFTCSIGIPLFNKSVAIVRRNRCGCTFLTPARFPNCLNMYCTPATVRRS